MLGLMWTMAYWLVDQLTPGGAFTFNTAMRRSNTMNGFNAFYFSFITLSTVGYGDITPVSKVCPYACGNRSHDRVTLCRRFDFTLGFTLFKAKISMIPTLVL